MNNTLSKFKRLAKQFTGLFPSALPVGVTAFDAWVDDLANTYTLPTQDLDSIKFAIASTIMHQGPTVAFRSKFYFVLILRAGAAKQIAAQAFQDIKLKHQAAQQAAAQQEAPKEISVQNEVI